MGDPLRKKGTLLRVLHAREMETRAILRRAEVTSQKAGCHLEVFLPESSNEHRKKD